MDEACISAQCRWLLLRALSVLCFEFSLRQPASALTKAALNQLGLVARWLIARSMNASEAG
jgi:hypothetical protein